MNPIVAIVLGTLFLLFFMAVVSMVEAIKSIDFKK